MMPNEISVERLLEQDIPELVGFHNDIVMVNNFGDMSLFAHPVRLRATTYQYPAGTGPYLPAPVYLLFREDRLSYNDWDTPPASASLDMDAFL